MATMSPTNRRNGVMTPLCVRNLLRLLTPCANGAWHRRRRGLNTWLARLPMEAKEKDEWRYWQADLLLERGREAEAKEILHQLMQQRGFYPMVAAQRIGEEYELKIDKAPQNVDSALTQGPEMARVRELMYWNLDNTARSEWANLVKSKSKTEQAQLARYAFNNQWWDLSVQATIAGKLGIIWKNDSRGLQRSFQTLHQWEGDPAKLCDGDCPSGECLESESEIAGRGQRPDADYAGHGDPYGEDVLYSWL